MFKALELPRFKLDCKTFLLVLLPISCSLESDVPYGCTVRGML